MTTNNQNTSNTLSPKAMEVIQSFLHLPFSDKDISCPYYNNRRGGLRAGLRVLIGKGEAKEIVEEAILIGKKDRTDLLSLSNDNLKKYLVDHKIGIDCSGLAYYILNAESISECFGSLRKNISFPNAKNILRKIISKIRPAESTGVLSLAHEKNSREIELSKIQPGDFIVMLHTGIDKSYNHVVTIWKTNYENGTLKVIHYIHSFAWPTDGKYNHGVRSGTIEIIDQKKLLQDQLWTEQNKTGIENYTQEKAREALEKSIRRLNWF